VLWALVKTNRITAREADAERPDRQRIANACATLLRNWALQRTMDVARTIQRRAGGSFYPKLRANNRPEASK